MHRNVHPICVPILCVTTYNGDRRLMCVTKPGDLMLLEEAAAVARVSGAQAVISGERVAGRPA